MKTNSQQQPYSFYGQSYYPVDQIAYQNQFQKPPGFFMAPSLVTPQIVQPGMFSHMITQPGMINPGMVYNQGFYGSQSNNFDTNKNEDRA